MKSVANGACLNGGGDSDVAAGDDRILEFAGLASDKSGVDFLVMVQLF